MKPKKPTRLTKCITCHDKLGDLKSINCILCVGWVCLPCSKLSEDLYKFCEDNKEQMAFLCQDCKLEIPSLREMKSIKVKQTEIETRQTEIETGILTIQKDSEESKKTVTDLSETQIVHGQEIDRFRNEIKDVLNRLNTLETAEPVEPLRFNETQGASGDTWATRTAATVQTLVRSEINERAEIEKIRMNLVISGMQETNSDEEDKTAVISLIEQELHITADINKTERIGKIRTQKRGDDPPSPRLIKLCFVTQRSRKEVLAKVTNLRKSSNDHIKKLVYIRPDLTHSQLEASKNLRAQLKTTRENNPDKHFKIHRNQIIEVTPVEPAETQEIVRD